MRLSDSESDEALPIVSFNTGKRTKTVSSPINVIKHSFEKLLSDSIEATALDSFWGEIEAKALRSKETDTDDIKESDIPSIIIESPQMLFLPLFPKGYDPYDYKKHATFHPSMFISVRQFSHSLHRMGARITTSDDLEDFGQHSFLDLVSLMSTSLDLHSDLYTMDEIKNVLQIFLLMHCDLALSSGDQFAWRHVKLLGGSLLRWLDIERLPMIVDVIDELRKGLKEKEQEELAKRIVRTVKGFVPEGQIAACLLIDRQIRINSNDNWTEQASKQLSDHVPKARLNLNALSTELFFMAERLFLSKLTSKRQYFVLLEAIKSLKAALPQPMQSNQPALALNCHLQLERMQTLIRSVFGHR